MMTNTGHMVNMCRHARAIGLMTTWNANTHWATQFSLVLLLWLCTSSLVLAFFTILVASGARRWCMTLVTPVGDDFSPHNANFTSLAINWFQARRIIPRNYNNILSCLSQQPTIFCSIHCPWTFHLPTHLLEVSFCHQILTEEGLYPSFKQQQTGTTNTSTWSWKRALPRVEVEEEMIDCSSSTMNDTPVIQMRDKLPPSHWESGESPCLTQAI